MCLCNLWCWPAWWWADYLAGLAVGISTAQAAPQNVPNGSPPIASVRTPLLSLHVSRLRLSCNAAANQSVLRSTLYLVRRG